MLPLVQQLVRALETEGILYCHWKSNAFVDRAAQGDDDLDLLVAPADGAGFLAVLQSLGFKEGLAQKGKRAMPGVLDYYGHDETARRLVHVHLHFKLVLGHDMTKNYHLPIEKIYLASSAASETLRVPAPELEWITFVVRMTLKHATWNAVLERQSRLSNRERQEMEYLQKHVAPGKTDLILADHLPSLSPALLEAGVRSLSADCPLGARLSAGRRVQKALRQCRLRPRGTDTWLQFWRRWVRAGIRRVLGRKPRKSLKNGGMLVAFVGGDGSGKTTVIRDVLHWLSPPFATAAFHMGKPDWSATTTLVRGLLKIGRTFGLAPFTRVSADPADPETPAVFPGYPELIRTVCTARDRYRTYCRARRLADKGTLVICDRFPVPGRIPMDGPRIESLARSKASKSFIRGLGRLEKRYYRAILEPDLLIVLRADPETAVSRKTDENPASVRARSEQVWNADWRGSSAIVIDANQSQDEVLRGVKGLLWSRL